MRVAIIGAGISGLAWAYYLQKLGVRYDLFEAEKAAGGMIKSVRQGNYQLELGPQFLQMTQEMHELLLELKLDQDVVMASSSVDQLYLRKNGAYQPLPASPLNSLFTCSSFWAPQLASPKEEPDSTSSFSEETVSHFCEKEYGKELVEEVVRPLVASVYGGNPDVLLIEKAFPYLHEVKTCPPSSNSVTHEPITPPQFFTLAQGLQSLPKAIASKLVSLHLDHEVEMIHKTKGKFFLSIRHDGEGLGDEEYDLVVLALPAYSAAELLNFTAPGLAAALENVTYAPMQVVHTVYRKLCIGQPLEGLGALHLQKDNPFSSNVYWTSSLFPTASPEDEVLFTSFVGGTQFPDQATSPHEEILNGVHQELKDHYAISSAKPLFQVCHSWPKALPQADMFILDVHRLAQMVEEDHIYACANWVSGPALPACIQFAKQLSQKIYSKRPSFQ